MNEAIKSNAQEWSVAIKLEGAITAKKANTTLANTMQQGWRLSMDFECIGLGITS